MLAGAALNRDPQLRLQAEDDIRSGEEEHWNTPSAAASHRRELGRRLAAVRCKWGVKVVLTNDIIRAVSHFKPPFIYEKSAALNMKIQIETRLAFFCS